jgi:hypothetical protein
MHPQHHLVGVPIGEEIHRRRHGKGHDHAGLAAEEKADGEEQAGHRRQKQAGAHRIHGPQFSLLEAICMPHMMVILNSDDKTATLSPAARRAFAE